MSIPARRLICAAAVSGATALALLANPALAGAVVFAGNADVTVNGSALTVQFAGVAADGISLSCQVRITDDPATSVIVEPQFVPVVAGSATYTTTLPDGDYLVAAGCSDSDTFRTMTPDTAPIDAFNLGDGEPVTLLAPPPPLPGGFIGSVDMGGMFGSS